MGVVYKARDTQLDRPFGSNYLWWWRLEAPLPTLATWFSAGDHSFYLGGSGRSREFRRIDHASGADTLVRALPRETAGGTSNFTVSPDGHWLIFVRVDQQISDLMLIDNFR